MEKNLTKEQGEDIISTLAHMRLRPALYFQGGFDGLKSWRYGFQTACSMLDVVIFETEEEVGKKRGWEYNALGATPSMKEKGLSEDEMVVEYITILIQSIQMQAGIGNEVILKLHNTFRECNEKWESASFKNKVKESTKKLLELIDKIEADMQNET